MSDAHFVLTRVRGALVVTLQDTADAGTLKAASEALMEELGNATPRVSCSRFRDVK